VVSVTLEAAASAQLSALSKSVQPTPSTGADSFGALVDGTPSDPVSTPSPVPQAVPSSQAVTNTPTQTPSPASNSATSATSAGTPTTANSNPDKSSAPGQQTTGNPAGTNPAGTGKAAGASGNSGTSQTGDGKSTGKSSGKSANGTATQTDSSSQAQADTPTAQIPVPPPIAAAVANTTVTTNSTTPASSGDSNAPLAIANNAIATSSSTVAALVGQTDLGKSAATTTTGSVTTDVKGQAPGTATGAAAATAVAGAQAGDDEAPGTVGLGLAANGALPSLAPTKGAVSKTAATTQAAPSGTTTTDPTAATATTPQPVPQPTDANASQPAAGGNQAANAALVVAVNEEKPQGSNTGSPASHDQTVTPAATAQTTTPDPAVQAPALPQQIFAAQPTAPIVSVATAGAAVPLSGLAVEIAASAQSGKTRFEVRLDPADLGRIDVRIDVNRNGQVTSHLIVEKPETLSMLKQDAPQLQQALNNAGLKTDSGGLQFSLRDQSSSSQNNGSQTQGNAQKLIVSDETNMPAAIAGQSYNRTLGSSGGIDIRV